MPAIIVKPKRKRIINTHTMNFGVRAGKPRETVMFNTLNHVILRKQIAVNKRYVLAVKSPYKSKSVQ